MEQAATKQDINELKTWILEREVTAIRWFVTMQLTYVLMTLGGVYFMLQHFKG